MYSDYHVHSRFSFDSDEEPKIMIQKAISLGMKQICFTDHQDYNWPVKGETPLLNFKDYFGTLSSLKEQYSDSIEVLIGVELGLVEGTEDLCRKLVSEYPFDFIIGSCHVVDNMDPYYPDFWENRGSRKAMELYFQTLYRGLKAFHQIDALGHFDYIVRYNPDKSFHYNVLDYRDLIDTILELMISKDIKLEINTAGLANGYDFPNPHTDIIRRYRELGGMEVTIGSDAHKAPQIGYAFEKAAGLAHRFGLKIYVK